MQAFDLEDLPTDVAPTGASEAVIGIPCFAIALIVSVAG
jgi:hypothetical protein